MTPEEYSLLFHRAQVNLVAFKQVFHCDDELRKMVEMTVAAEREACAKVCDELPAPDIYSGTDKSMWEVTCTDCGDAIRARGETK